MLARNKVIMLFILLAFLSLNAASLGQNTNGTIHVVDTKDDLGWWTVAVDRTSYSDDFSQFIQEATELATTNDIEFPSKAQLGNLEGFKGLWWTLWDEIYGHWTGSSTLKYSGRTQSVQYLSLDYALCGNSTITVTLTSQVIAIISNNLTEGSNDTFICDGQIKQSDFKLGGAYSITLELNVYSSGENETGPLGFALIDKITTIDEPFVTREPRPNTTRHTWITEKSTTPMATSTTTENSDGGAAFARLHAVLCAMIPVFILAAIV